MMFHGDLLATTVLHTGNENKESMFSPLNGLIDVQTDNAFYLIYSTFELQGQECLIFFPREVSGILHHYLFVVHLWPKCQPSVSSHSPTCTF